jgi:hypothetical protein
MSSVWKSQWANYIHDGTINQAIAKWHNSRPDREQDCATPSTLTDCPRVVWLKYRKKIPPVIPMGWGKSQRNMLGRAFVAVIDPLIKDIGNLLYWWKDDTPGESVKFEMGKGESRVCGTPDLLLKIGDKVYISDAKTSMAKSFGYVPIKAPDVFQDYLWFKYQLQVEAYYMLCHKNKDWFHNWKNLSGVELEQFQYRYKALPLPEACHLFSYALDDGVNRREFMWTPTQDSMAKVLYYAKRWNRAYASETMPDCTCSEFDGTPTKFCYYVQEQETTKSGYKIGTKCCGEELYNKGGQDESSA